MILHWYFFRRFMKNLLLVGFAFFCLSMLLELESHLFGYSQYDLTSGDIIKLSILKLPRILYNLTPLIFLVGSLATALRLSHDSEFIAAKSAGRPGYRTVLVIGGLTFVAGILLILVFSTISAYSSRTYNLEMGRFKQDQLQLFVEKDGYVWLRQELKDRLTVIRANETINGHTYFDVNFYVFDLNRKPLLRHYAEKAILAEQTWRLEQVKTWHTSESAGHSEAKAVLNDVVIYPTNISREQIIQLLQPADHKSVLNSRILIDQLTKSGFSTIRHKVHFHSELALPILLSMMTILGATLVQQTKYRYQGVLAPILTVIVGLGIFFLINFVRVLGENEILPVLVATWTLPVASLCLVSSMVLYLEHL